VLRPSAGGYAARVVRPHPQIQLTPRRLPGQGRSQVLVDSLLEATATVLLRDGFDDATTTEIARVAGVSVGSLYQYFPNKESLATALYERTEGEALDYVAENLLEGGELGLEDACHLIVLALVKIYADDRALWSMLLGVLPKIGGERKRAAVEARWHDLFRGMIAARGAEVRSGRLELGPMLVRRALAGTLEPLVCGQHELLERDALKDELTDLIFAYLRA
jgi:AcrR family transcriptional regulator